jgi:hypothetical protein
VLRIDDRSAAKIGGSQPAPAVTRNAPESLTKTEIAEHRNTIVPNNYKSVFVSFVAICNTGGVMTADFLQRPALIPHDIAIPEF